MNGHYKVAQGCRCTLRQVRLPNRVRSIVGSTVGQRPSELEVAGEVQAYKSRPQELVMYLSHIVDDHHNMNGFAGFWSKHRVDHAHS